MTKTIRIYMAFIALLQIYSCSKGDVSGGSDNVILNISLNKTSITLDVGSNETLFATINPANATNQNITWTSSNPAVATVNNGIVTAVMAGETTITVTTVDGKKSDKCNVTVVASDIGVVSVSLNKNSTFLNVGNNETLFATINPANATNQNITWTSSNPAVATVNNGIVTAVMAGETTITVTTVDGKKSDKCNVTVVASNIGVVSVSLSKTTISLKVGEAQTLYAKINPANATNQNIIWSSSNESIVTVSGNGVIRGVKLGSAIITVTTVDGGNIANCNVSVKANNNDIEIDWDDPNLDNDGIIELKLK